MDLEAVLTQALAALSAYGESTLAELAEARRPDVVSWRWTAGGTSPQRPEPWFNESRGREAAWAETPPRSTRTAVGLDGAGRPVLTELRWPEIDDKRLEEVWFHGDGWSDVLSREGAARILFDDGRVVATVGRSSLSAEIEVWDWAEERPVRSRRGGISETFVVSDTCVAEYDASGGLAALWRGVETPARSEPEDTRAVLAALGQAARLVPEHRVFDARTARRVHGLRPSGDVVAVLAPAVEEAVAAAVGAAGVDRPFVVELRLADDSFPPFVRVGSDRFRARMSELSPEQDAALRLLHEAKPPDGATLELLDHLSDDALTACRELNWALSHERPFDDPERARANAISEQLGREWAQRFNGRSWPAVADPFLVLVRIGRQFEDIDPYELALPATGRERIERFRASIASRATVRELDSAAVTEGAALEADLTARGLAGKAPRIAAAAQPSFRLRQADRDVATRLGGRGLLPAGEPWPHAAGDRPLTFLAGVALAELPQPNPLPDAGWLLFYADLDNDEALGLIEPVANEPGSPARLFYVPPDREPVEAEPPPGLRQVLEARHVVPVPQLTLPDDYDVAERLGLDPAEASVHEEVAHRLRYGDEGWGSEVGDHWILGAVTGVQSHPAEPGTVLLLHMAFDSALAFEYLDGGAIQFRIPEIALAKGDWGAVTIEPDSG